MNYLSIVNIISNEHLEPINELAEILGMGADSLSIKLQDDDGQIYWGCHSWWSIEKYIIFRDIYAIANMGIDIDRYKAAMKDLHEFLINTENMTYDQIKDIPGINMQTALTDLGLTQL